MINKKILICDDDKGILEVLEMMLEMDDYEVVKENDSTNLINNVISCKPDLLLMDLWMPIISGDELLRKIRLDENLKRLPVIIISASIDGSEIAGKAGADAYIRKPFDMDDTLLKIRNLLQKRIN